VRPVALTRGQFAFRNGESLLDVAARTDRVVDAVLKPWMVWAHDAQQDAHVLIVAHGITIAELVRSIQRLNPGSETFGLGPLSNTAFHTFRLHLQPDALPRLSPEVVALAKSALEAPGFPSTAPLADIVLPMQVSVVAARQDQHLTAVPKRQKGGIGSMAYDHKQRDIKSFFGGGGAPKSSPTKTT
jgi:hypothetical protein